MAAPNGLIVAWPSTAASIPAGWSRYATLNDRLPKPASSSITTTGGSDTHTHSTTSHDHTDAHTHASMTSDAASGGSIDTFAGGTASRFTTHTHTTTLTAASLTTGTASGTSSTGSSIDFARFSVIWIQSDGTTDIPTNAVAYSNQVTRPTGWTAYSSGINFFLRGATAGADGGTSTASTTHTHTYSHTHTSSTSHTHTAATSSTGNAPNGITSGVTATGSGHTHTASGSSNSATHSTASGSDATASGTETSDPPFYKLETVQASGASPAPKGIIALWTTTSAPVGWAACDGSNGTPNINGSGNFIKGANGTGEIGSTGTTSHTHTGTSHTHTLGTDTHTDVSGISLSASGTTTTLAGVDVTPNSIDTHTHTFTGASGVRVGPTGAQTYTYSSPTVDPAYANMFFIMALDSSGGGQYWQLPVRPVRRNMPAFIEQENMPLAISTLPAETRFLMGASVQ